LGTAKEELKTGPGLNPLWGAPVEQFNGAGKANGRFGFFWTAREKRNRPGFVEFLSE